MVSYYRVRLVPATCLLVGLASVALVATSLAQKPPPGTSSSTQSSTQAPVIGEIAPLVLGRKGEASGTLTVRSVGKNCRALSYSGSFKSVKGITLPSDVVNGTTLVLSFLPGVRHQFQGHVCWRSKTSVFTDIHENADTEADYRGDTAVFGEVSHLEGTATIAAKTPSREFDIQSDSSKPLVFAVTVSGYRYVSGSGKVRSPQGSTYVFP